MPLNTKSTYTHLTHALYEAYEISEGMEKVDTELDLEGLEKPKFGNHALRRYSDKRACDTADKSGSTKGAIDDHFGWDQRKRKKESQLHYHGRTERLKRARVTMYV